MLTIEEQRKLKEDTEKDPNFKHFLPGKPVLLNIPRHGPKEFEKETSAKRGQIFLIHSLDFRQVPVMFKLKAIDGSRIRGNCLNVILVMLFMLLFLCFLYLFHSCSLGFFKVNQTGKNLQKQHKTYTSYSTSKASSSPIGRSATQKITTCI